jgi:hypothetical protein
MKKKEAVIKSTPEVPSNDAYYFGKLEVLKFEELNLPQFELSVFASADPMGDANCDGGGGDNRTCPPSTV